MKSIFWRRSAVIDIELITRSYLPATRSGIIRSQRCLTRVHEALIALHSALAMSTSKPMSLPFLSVVLNGGYSPSIAICRVCAGALVVLAASAEVAAINTSAETSPSMARRGSESVCMSTPGREMSWGKKMRLPAAAPERLVAAMPDLDQAKPRP